MTTITFSATDARIHFGKVMRQAQTAPVVVERGGEPQVVILSIATYYRLVDEAPSNWRELVRTSRNQIAAHLQGRELPDPAETIRLGRDVRDEQIVDALR